MGGYLPSSAQRSASHKQPPCADLDGPRGRAPQTRQNSALKKVLRWRRALGGATASEPLSHGFSGNWDKLPLRLKGNFLLTAPRPNVYMSQ